MMGRAIASADRFAWTASALGLLAALIAHPAAAREEKAPAPVEIFKHDAENKDVFKFDFAVPSSPALTLLGVDKDKITQSNSLKPFVISAPSVLSSSTTGQAISLDVAPAAYFTKPTERFARNYNRGTALFFRTRVAAAVYEGVKDADASKQKPSRVSLGLSSSLLENSDPLLAPLPGDKSGASAWKTCFDQSVAEIEKALPPAPNTPLMVQMKAEERELNDKINSIYNDLQNPNLSAESRVILNERIAELTVKREEAKQKFNDELAQATKEAGAAYGKTSAAKLIPLCMKVADLSARLGQDLDVGAGAVWDGKAGAISGFKDPTAVVWASYRRAFGVEGPKQQDINSLKTWYDDFKSWYMIGLSTRLGFDESVSTGDKTKPKVRADTYSGWIGLERYSETTRFAVQLGRRKTSPTQDADKAFGGTQSLYLVSYDRQVRDGVWLTVSHGKADGDGALKSDKTTRVAFTFTAPDAKKIFGGP